MAVIERKPELDIKRDIPYPHHLAARMFCKTYENKYGSPYNQERVEKECGERFFLCQELQKIDPDNPTWKYAGKFFETFPSGPDAIMELFNNWGVFELDKEDRRLGKELHTPENLEGVHVREFMDLDPNTVRGLILKQEGLSNTDQKPSNHSNFLKLTEEARQASWDEYDKLKNELLVSGGVPLLSRDYIQTVIGKDPNPKCLIGLSYDELTTYRTLYGKKRKNLTPPILGISRGFSSSMTRAIEEGQITKLDSKGKLITPSDLNSGGAYIIEGDIGNSMPITKNEFTTAMLYVLHHNGPRDEQVKLLGMLSEIATPMGKNDENTGLLVFEPFSSKELLQMVVETNYWMGHPTALFDAAVGTTICGGQTRKSLSELGESVNEKTGKNTKWRTQTYPSLPPFKTFQKNILPIQQVALIGY
jgi:hypothetical protein